MAAIAMVVAAIYVRGRIDEKGVSEQIVRLLTRGIVSEGRIMEDAR